MKRYIIISLLTVMTAKAFGCSIPGTHNYYLFSTVKQLEWNQGTDNRCMDNWRAYAGDKEMYWFNYETLREIAQKKGDALMVSYLDQLQKYLDVAMQVHDSWEYPSKAELARRRQILSSVQQYALSKTKTRLRSQHALLYMRCNMMLGQHQQNVRFWEQTAHAFINSVYRDMMRNIYAGALLKTGRTDEATQIFVEQGDMSSLYTYYYEKRSLEAIRKEYQKNPNSAAMPFLLQDFANNAQEAIDAQAEGAWPGKLFIRDIKQAEAMDMCKLARQVVSEGKSKNPALWKTTEAWLQFLYGNKQQARKSIDEACSMEGAPRIKDNARVLRLFIRSDVDKVDATLDDFLADELEWLEQKAKEERGDDSNYDNHYTRAYDRLVHQVLTPRYAKANRPCEAAAFLSVYNKQSVVFYTNIWNQTHSQDEDSSSWNEDYSSDFFNHIDTIDVNALEHYLAYTNRTPATRLDKWLSARLHHDDLFLYELIGTKCLRLGQWQQAIDYLEKVPLSFVNKMNIVPFMAHRSYQVEPWMKRQSMANINEVPGSVEVSTNQKLEFAREMLRLEQEYAALPATKHHQKAYELASRYVQASFAGDAWYLTRYGKSCGDNSSNADRTNLLGKAKELLNVAQTSTDFLLKEKALYALAFLPIDSWYVEDWSDKENDIVRIPQRQSYQYKALKALADFEKQNATRTSRYVSHCDVLKQFAKY